MVKHVARAASRLVVLFVVVGLVGGCAGYKVEENGRGCGYDVYAPEPYLLATPGTVSATTTLTYTYSIVWLPNYGKRYRVHSWAGLGKANFTFIFKEGWKLEGITDVSDNSGIMTALAGLAAPLLPTDPWKGRDVPMTPVAGLQPDLQPILYRIDFDKGGRPSCLRRLARGETSCDGAGNSPLPKPCP